MNGILLNHFPKWYYFIPKSPNNQVLVRFNPHIDREQPKKLSEIFPVPLGCHQELLLDMMGRGRPSDLPGSPPSRNGSHIPGGTARNSEKTPGKTPCVPDDDRLFL